MENWLSVIVGIYLLLMILYGHYKGFIRLAVSMFALIISLTAVRVAMPAVSGMIREKTALSDVISENTKKWIGIETTNQPPEDGGGLPATQRLMIEQSDLPQTIKDILIENNNSEVYEMLGVDAFADYIGRYLAEIILNSVVFLALFLIFYVVIRLVVSWLDIIAKLPVLSGINKLAGALLGLAQGLVFLWIGCFAITALSGTQWGNIIIKQIEASKWLSYLYNHNFLNIIVLTIFKRI